MKRRQYRFYYKLVTFFFILSTIPVIIVGFFSYQRSAETIEQNVTNEKLQTVGQMQLNIEHILKTVDHSFTNYVRSYPLIETLSRSITPERFQLYNQINQELNKLQTFDTDLSDITMISQEKKWYINNSGLYKLDQGKQALMVSLYNSLKSRSSWLLEKNNALVATKEGGSEDCPYNVNLVKQLPLNSMRHKGLAIASIPSCSLVKRMPLKSKTNSMMALDDNGRIILHQKRSQIGQSIRHEDYFQKIRQLSSKNGQFDASIGDTDYKITYQKSDYNNWIYVSMTTMPELYMQTASIGWFTFSICGILLALSLLFSWFGSRHFYKPIKVLYESVSGFASGTDKERHESEFELIERNIKEMKNKNHDLAKRVEQQVTQLKQYFLTRLLLGKLIEEETKARFSGLGFSDDWSHLSVLALQIDTLKDTPYEKKDLDVLLFAINSLVEQSIPKENRLPSVVIDKTQTTVMLNRGKSLDTFHQQLKSTAESIQHKIHEEFGVFVSIGISQPFTNLSMSKHAYLEGLEALTYRLKSGKRAIIFFEHLDRNKAFLTQFPKQLQNELFEAIKACEREKAAERLHQLIETVCSENTNPHHCQIAIVRLLNNLIEFMHLLGIELFEPDGNNMLYDDVFELTTIEEIESWLNTRIVSNMIETLSVREESQYKNISEKIVHIIQQEFDTDLTLESIAGRLHYNPNYLSSIFRKEMKISFSEYLSSYRHHIAKSWLTETSLSVKEISEKLKYKNPQNFIRSFKKLEGITPGKYRELKNHSA
ncbi:helix-turn-helix domain-containing protein [Bacillus glycinifermentans]|uniref:helix-turn-helix domain-containing protein n=1 Tax=Bacillus glycinifermentans TaxID=1664069 RepID=UPI002DBB848D|nr:helix-turn-helix domain-containing protein [Bacillus glycinifermentans]MEC3605500.1 helix-turn-helix domain-containing protein [Bacillus glycinifermentans]